MYFVCSQVICLHLLRGWGWQLCLLCTEGLSCSSEQHNRHSTPAQESRDWCFDCCYHGDQRPVSLMTSNALSNCAEDSCLTGTVSSSPLPHFLRVAGYSGSSSRHDFNMPGHTQGRAGASRERHPQRSDAAVAWLGYPVRPNKPIPALLLGRTHTSFFFLLSSAHGLASLNLESSHRILEVFGATFMSQVNVWSPRPFSKFEP